MPTFQGWDSRWDSPALRPGPDGRDVVDRGRAEWEAEKGRVNINNFFKKYEDILKKEGYDDIMDLLTLIESKDEVDQMLEKVGYDGDKENFYKSLEGEIRGRKSTTKDLQIKTNLQRSLDNIFGAGKKPPAVPSASELRQRKSTYARSKALRQDKRLQGLRRQAEELGASEEQMEKLNKISLRSTLKAIPFAQNLVKSLRGSEEAGTETEPGAGAQKAVGAAGGGKRRKKSKKKKSKRRKSKRKSKRRKSRRR